MTFFAQRRCSWLCLLAAAASVSLSGCHRATVDPVEQAFHRADADRSGSLSPVEFASTQRASKLETDEPGFAKADKDEDGVLSFKEFDATHHPYRKLLWILGIFSSVSFVGSLIAIPIVVARLPEDHFVAEHRAADWVGSSTGRRLWLVLKNFLGLLLIAGGLLMLILPGQGVLTLLLGVALMDLPGKWKLMRALARRPNVMKALNWMRSRAHKPPMLAPRPSKHPAAEVTTIA